MCLVCCFLANSPQLSKILATDLKLNIRYHLVLYEIEASVPELYKMASPNLVAIRVQLGNRAAKKII
jgi:hypothetical protein